MLNPLHRGSGLAVGLSAELSERTPLIWIVAAETIPPLIKSRRFSCPAFISSGVSARILCPNCHSIFAHPARHRGRRSNAILPPHVVASQALLLNFRHNLHHKGFAIGSQHFFSIVLPS